jgi:hypothetical protein
VILLLIVIAIAFPHVGLPLLLIWLVCRYFRLRPVPQQATITIRIIQPKQGVDADIALSPPRLRKYHFEPSKDVRQ